MTIHGIDKKALPESLKKLVQYARDVSQIHESIHNIEAAEKDFLQELLNLAKEAKGELKEVDGVMPVLDLIFEAGTPSFNDGAPCLFGVSVYVECENIPYERQGNGVLSAAKKLSEKADDLVTSMPEEFLQYYFDHTRLIVQSSMTSVAEVKRNESYYKD